MTESLTTPLIITLVGCIVSYSFRSQSKILLWAGFICGVAATIRPSCLPLVIAPFLAVVIGSGLRSKIPAVLAMLLLWAAPIVAERIYSQILFGPELTSPMGRHAFMKAGVIEAPPVPPRSTKAVDRLLAHALNHDYEPARRMIAKAPSRNIRYILLSTYEACFGYPCGDDLVKGIHLRRSEIDQAMFAVGVARLASNIPAYLRLTATEYHRLWLLHPRKDPDLAREYNAFLARNGPLPFASFLGEYGQPTPASIQNSVFRLNRIGFAGVGLAAALLTLMLALIHGRALARAALCLLVASQAVLVLGAFLGVGLPRYPMGLWPALFAGMLLGGVGLWESFQRWKAVRKCAA